MAGRALKKAVILIGIFAVSACATVDRQLADRVTGKYVLNEASEKLLIDHGYGNNLIESIKDLYILKNRSKLAGEYLSIEPAELIPVTGSRPVFYFHNKGVTFEFQFENAETKSDATGIGVRFDPEHTNALGIVNPNSRLILNFDREGAGISHKPPPAPPWMPAHRGIDAADRLTFETIKDEIRSGVFGDLHSLIIIKDGGLIVEEYFNGSHESHIHWTASVTKSIMSVVLGIAIDRGFVREDQRMVDIFGRYRINNLNENKKMITVRDLVTMRHGIDWQRRGFKDYWRMVASEDWIQYVLDKPVRKKPGRDWVYCNGSAILIGGIIEETTGNSLRNFAERHLFSKVGIKDYHWARMDKAGNLNTAAGLKMTARDMARFGLLVLNRGTWENRRIVSEAYLGRALQPGPVVKWPQMSYGYQWWILKTEINGKQTHVNAAFGYGEQQIWVLPTLNAVVVVTAWVPEGKDTGKFDLVKLRIIPALEKLQQSGAADHQPVSTK